MSSKASRSRRSWSVNAEANKPAGIAKIPQCNMLFIDEGISALDHNHIINIELLIMIKTIHLKKILTIILSASILAACNNASSKTNKADVLAVNMDTTLQAGEDIFLYANGGWIKNNPIPAEESQWGIGNLVIEENTKRLREISENAAKENAAKGTPSQKIGDFWHAAMDTLQIEKQGSAPLNSYLTKITAINDTKSLLSVLAELDQIGVVGPIQFFVAQDAKHSDLNALQLWQTGIGLPEREY